MFEKKNPDLLHRVMGVLWDVLDGTPPGYLDEVMVPLVEIAEQKEDYDIRLRRILKHLAKSKRNHKAWPDERISENIDLDKKPIE
jgi:hypothetical protein